MAFEFKKKVTFPDAEDIICRFLIDEFAEATPKVHVGTWIPDSSEEYLNKGEAIVIVNRVGGSADYDARAIQDRAVICVSALGHTRRDAMAVAQYVRQSLYDISSGATVGDWRISKIVENEGPTNVLYSSPVEKLVRLYFQVGIDRHRR